MAEEFLFFRQYSFHKQKLAFHRASMKYYESFLKSRNFTVEYIESAREHTDIRKLIPEIKKKGFDEIHFVDPVDDWLGRRLARAAEEERIRLVEYDSPMFLKTKKEINHYFKGKSKFRQTDFYIRQRKKLGILLEPDGKPIGGKWTYDSENRLRYPRKKVPPRLDFPDQNKFYKDAKIYVAKNFGKNYGELSARIHYPSTFEETAKWFDRFLEGRFREFGVYQDAIVSGESFLHHSVVSPMLNVGLITPKEIMEKVIDAAKEYQISLNSVEGFIRQILGWREFLRGIYQTKGSIQRTSNYWGFTRKIPDSFWRGSTGIDPLDIVIKRTLETGYCHHIERLMVLGNFMLLCEFDPDEVYRWFMELFVDAYDWVMVPNVYGMSQFADGGLMASKPYISSSNYLMKMSDFKKEKWQHIWDALFWRFMHIHRDFFLQNPRMGMLIRTFDRMAPEKRQRHLNTAEEFLERLY